MSIIKVYNVWKFFGTTKALEDVTLELGRGLHLLLGPNGSGKSTLLRLVCGLIKPSRGRVFVKDLDSWRNRDKLMKIMGVEFEDNTIPWWLSGREFLKFIALQKGADWDRVVEIAERLGVTSYWNLSVRGYSSGMRKKIIVLLPFIGDNEIIILDEPYTLLDREAIAELNKIISEKLKEVETIIIASHVFTGIEEKAYSVTVLINGKLVLHEEINKLVKTGEVTWECTPGNPLDAINNFYKQSVREIVVSGNKVLIKGAVKIDLVKNYNCKPQVNVREIYEKVLIGTRT